MIMVLRRLIAIFRNPIIKNKWTLLLVAFFALLISSLFVMPIFEGSEGSFKTSFDCFWWFIVTVTTVGYGDMFPVTLWGRVFAIFIIFFGIGMAAVLVTDVTAILFEKRRTKMKGDRQLSLKEHIVVLGYVQGRTENLIEETLADDKRADRKIVLCADSESVSENPMSGKVEFVRGDLSSDDVMKRSCLSEADRIVIKGKNDEHTILIALAVRAYVKEGAKVVASIDRDENAKHLERVDGNIAVIKSVSTLLAVQEMQDGGVAKLVYELLSNKFGAELYKIVIPQGLDLNFKGLSRVLKKTYGSTAIAVSDNGYGMQVNPEDDYGVTGGMSVYVIADGRPTINAKDFYLKN